MGKIGKFLSTIETCSQKATNLVSRENLPYLPLATVGAIQGAYKYYRPEPTAEKAWMCLIGAVSIYELTCPKGETLSEGIDRSLNKHRLATTLAIGVTALHLLNVLPEKIDPFHRAITLLKHD